MKKILFVEDELSLLKLITSVLQSEGYEVLQAPDGEMAIKILSEEKLDLVLLDLVLPKKDGYDVLEYIKSKKEIKNVPVIVLTNLEDKFDIEKAMSYGVQSYLVKANYKTGEIIEKIKEIFNAS